MTCARPSCHLPALVGCYVSLQIGGYYKKAWIMGWLICKTVPYLQGVSVSASINTLVAISVERCLAICYPLRWQVTPRACRCTVAVIWLFSLTITLPWAVVFGLAPLQEGSSVHVCTELWPSALSENVYFALAHLLMCYLFPLALISACYLLIWRRVCQRTPPGERCTPAVHSTHAPPPPPSGVDVMIHRSKVKVVKMLLAVVVTFALSWLPLYALFARVKFGGPPHSAGEEALIHAVLPVAQWLGASNSCVNPVFYTAFNRKFRAAFRAILTSRSCCGPLRYDDSFATSSARSSIHSKLARGVTRGPSAAAAAVGSVHRRKAAAGEMVTASSRKTTTSSFALRPTRSVNALLSSTAVGMTTPAAPAMTAPSVETPRRLASSASLHAACVTKAVLPSARTVHNFMALANGAGDTLCCTATSATDILAYGSIKATQV